MLTIDGSTHGSTILDSNFRVAILRAWVAHPAYQIKNLDNYQQYLLNPHKFLSSMDSKHRLNFNNNLNTVRRMLTFDEVDLPFHICRWCGDLPDWSAIVNHELSTGIPCVVCVNAVFSQEFKNKWEGKVYELSAPWMSLYYDNVLTEFENCEVEKDFACPINRLDPNRQSWFYLLIRRKLLNRGMVSFNLDNSRSTVDIKNLSQIEAFENLYQKFMLNFEDEHNIAKHIVPYRNFPADEDLDLVLMKCRFNIVLETYSSFNDQMMITEKTIRSLRLPRPWLLHGAKGSVAQLRKWGFDVLDEFVDHARYDDIDDSVVRQSVILDIAQELCNFDTIKNWDRLKAAATNNNEILLNWKNAFPQIAFDDFYKIFDDYAIRNNLPTK